MDNKEPLIAQKEGKSLLGIQIKPTYTIANLFAPSYLHFFGTTAGGYMNAQSVFLLSDPEYFGIEGDRIGRVTS